jgi:hypothetical protein
MTEKDWHGKEIKDEHAKAIGRIAYAWNELHEHLSEVFGLLFAREDYGLALTAWHALATDAGQRDMLKAVAKVKLGSDSKAYHELKWALKKIKEPLAKQRNTGVHLPLMIFTDMSQGPASPAIPQILPNMLFGNRKARNMTGRDLLKEYSHNEGQIRKLTTYLVAIAFNISPVREHSIWASRLVPLNECACACRWRDRACRG